jgi:two-component system sensor histidine kinase/response regulator
MGNDLTNQIDFAHILIVDDNPHNLQVLGQFLQQNNFEIEFATNGETALEWIASSSFDLILLDINMPGMNGFDVCRRIRAEEKNKRMPIIFLSADTDRESLLTGFELGAQDYVTKPFDSRELLVRVKTQLTLKQSLEKIEKTNKELESIVEERTLQLKNANIELERINHKLEELDTIKSEFLNLISHEIRTPLNGIVGITQLLKEPLLQSEFGAHFKALDTSVKRLENFSMNALLITELKTNPDYTEMHPVNIEHCIESVINTLANEASGKNSTIKTNFEAYPTNVNAVKDLIIRCFSNLIENAILYSGYNQTIEIETQNEFRFIQIVIKDHGDGFPEKILKSNFELFSTAGEYRDKALGIGIPLAKMIIDLHQGQIELKNNPEGGAQVTIQLPLSDM